MPNYPSSFDAPIELKNTVTAEEFLDNDWESVYQLVKELHVSGLENWQTQKVYILSKKIIN